MKESMIPPVREAAGLCSPPIRYTTNQNECSYEQCYQISR